MADNYRNKKNALVLTGGGAKAAYQVGVLRAISDIVKVDKIPFQIISGYSAGAINGIWLASRGEKFSEATRQMWDAWLKITPDKIYNTDAPSLMLNSVRWVKDRAFGGLSKNNQITYLLNTAPLKKLIQNEIDFDKVEANIQSGILHAVSVAATNYHSGHSVSFYSSGSDIQDWKKISRISQRVKFAAEHILASSSIPIFFSPVRIGNSFYGDGMVRLKSPLSAPIRLGAEQMMVIGVQGSGVFTGGDIVFKENITLGEIAGTVLNGLFFDTLDADLERMKKVNRVLTANKDVDFTKQADPLRYIPLLSIMPSQQLERISGDKLSRMPPMLRFLLEGIGLSETKGRHLLSYLSFEPNYIKSLLDLGYEDVKTVKNEVLEFFNQSN